MDVKQQKGRKWLDEAERCRPLESGTAATLFLSPLTSLSLPVSQLTSCRDGSRLPRGISSQFPLRVPLPLFPPRAFFPRFFPDFSS